MLATPKTKEKSNKKSLARAFTLISSEAERVALQNLINSHILTIDNVLDRIMGTKRQEVMKIHPYALTPPTLEGGRWQTSFKDESGKRKNIRANSKNELLDKLVFLYHDVMNIDKITFKSLFDEWLEHKKLVTESPNTIKRHQQHYNRYFLSSRLNDMDIKKITLLILEEESNYIVKKHHLTRKEWVNVKTILNGMSEYAMKKEYINVNPVVGMKISVKYKQVNKKTGKTETYNTEELRALNDYLDEKYSETGDIAFIAVRLNFFLGLRVAELVALKWEDRCDEKHLHIVREEIR